MAIVCKECNCDFLDDENLHRHLKAHKLKTSDYYIKHFPKFDLFSKEPIPFKNKDYYFDTDFLSKTNLRLWLKGQGKEVARDYCKKLLQKRIDKKNIKYSFCQVELRSLLIPAINYYQSLFGDYYSFCQSLGLKNKFSVYPDNLNFPSVEKQVKFIRQDSREQKPISFDFSIEIDGLNFGDYCLDNPELNENVFIERKSLPDALGTLSRGLERFNAEIERALLSNAYVVVLVEDSIEHALSFNHLPYIHCKMQPEAIFHSIRELLQRYNNLQFLFVNGKKEIARVAKRILFEKGLARNVDLELSFNLGIL